MPIKTAEQKEFIGDDYQDVHSLEPMSDELANKTVSNYVCSNCWGDLVKYHAPNRMSRVKCVNCGDDTPGFVTRWYAEKRRSESMADKLDIQINLRDIFPSEYAGKSPDELVKELGY